MVALIIKRPLCDYYKWPYEDLSINQEKDSKDIDIVLKTWKVPH